MAWIWFFIPLPQPLGLPDHYICKVYEHPSVRDLRSEVEVHPGVAEDKFAPRLKASILFWQRQGSIKFDERLQVLFDTAMDAFPSIKARGNRPEGVPVLPGDLMVAEAAAYVADPYESEQLTEAFNTILGAIRHVQEAYAFAAGHPVSSIYMGRLPSLVPYVIGDIDLETGRPSQEADLSIFMLSMKSVADVTQPPPLDADKFEHFKEAMTRPDRALWPYAKQRARALSLIEGDGDPVLGTTVAATAGQLLLDTILKHMCWESGMTPEACAELFADRGLTTRVKQDFHPRLGGTWDLTGKGPVAGFFRETAEVRHRIVHAAYEPDITEARSAFDALDDLEHYIADRLYAKSKPYPRTGINLLGTRGFERRGGNVPRRVRKRMDDDDDDEPSWIDTFGRWAWVVDDIVNPQYHAPGAVEDLDILILVTASDTRVALHDPVGRRIAPYTLDLPEHVVTLEGELKQQYSVPDNDLDSQIVIRMLEDPDPAGRSGDWVREHEMLHAAHLYLHDAPWMR